MNFSDVALLPENIPLILDEMICIWVLLENDKGGRGSGWGYRRSKTNQELKIVKLNVEYVCGSFSIIQHEV